MKQKRIVLGSGYAAVGYALARGETTIVEEREQLDTAFCLPLRSFAFPETEPKSEIGHAFLRICRDLGIIKGELVNTGALEIALAKLALDGGIRPLFKCRITEVSEHGAEIYSNSGFLTLKAETLHDARRACDLEPNCLTLLFEAEDAAACAAKLLSEFIGASIEPTFHEGRYAIHIPVDPTREPNALRAEIARRWEAADTSAKIFMIAPTLSAPLPSEKPSMPTLCDTAYRSPLEALEGGVAFACKEAEGEGA